MPRNTQAFALTAVFFFALPSLAPARELVHPENVPDETTVTPARPGNLPPDSRLEELIRGVYRNYETTVSKSGQNVRFNLRDFRTVLRHEFDEHEWLELMPPYDGMRIAQDRTYYEAPWLRVGEVVHYNLRWQPASEQQEKKADAIRELLQGVSIAKALRLERNVLSVNRNPLAITSVAVEVVFMERVRSYRAAAFWTTSSDDLGRFEMNLNDPVVVRLGSPMFDEATPATKEELQELDLLSSEDEQPQWLTAATDTGACEADVDTVTHFPLTHPDDQGHVHGGHQASLQMKARCEDSAACHVQCIPEITLTYCDETAFDNTGIELASVFCEHTGWHDSKISGAGADNRAVSCGSAIACGIKECCGLFCGQVSFSFSGTGAGLTATVSNTGSGRTYNLSIDDSIECAAPEPPPLEPCSGSSTTSGSRIAAATCIDGEEGPGGPEGGNEQPPGWEPGSPILLDLDRGGFRLTSLTGGVLFDIDADGESEQLSWTEADSGDAFLALDRNGNGWIDHGRELFGNFTEQPATAEPNGFLALRVFDQPAQGGNADGVISRADAVFPRLLLWHDSSHDGVSDGDEVSTLADSGVVSIDLDYVESRRRDRHGNEFRYASRVRLDRATTQAADVFFVVD